MENEKLKYILAKQKQNNNIKTDAQSPKPKEVVVKMRYEDFGLAYNMSIDKDFDDMIFLAKRIEEYRAGEKVSSILLDKDHIKIWLEKNA